MCERPWGDRLGGRGACYGPLPSESRIFRTPGIIARLCLGIVDPGSVPGSQVPDSASSPMKTTRYGSGERPHPPGFHRSGREETRATCRGRRKVPSEVIGSFSGSTRAAPGRRAGCIQLQIPAGQPVPQRTAAASSACRGSQPGRIVPAVIRLPFPETRFYIAAGAQASPPAPALVNR